MAYNNVMDTKKLSRKEWLLIVLIGFAGQLAWMIENNYINMWVFSQTRNNDYITWMTITSAIAATLTTFFMGALSDRLGKRKLFIAGGYSVWGITVFLFGLCSYHNSEAVFGASGAALGVGISMVIVDCLMTFFGSTANDAAFNARVTDITNEKNRGKVESVLSILPLIATIAVLGIAGLLGANAKPDASQEEIIASTGVSAADYLAKPWFLFFVIFGVITSIIGIICFIFLPKDEIKPNKNSSYWANLIYGFKPTSVKKNRDLYIALLAFMAFNMAIDSFMPYFMVYFQNSKEYHGLAMSGLNFYLPLGTILLVASAITVIIGATVLDKFEKTYFLLPALCLCGLGFLFMFFSKDTWAVIVSGILMMSGYLLGTAVCGAIVRNETPKEEVGLFQGVRMFFTVLIPMIVGSAISDLIMRTAYGTYIDPVYGTTVTAPNEYMFLVAFCFIVIALIPSIWLLVRKRKENRVSSIKENSNSN